MSESSFSLPNIEVAFSFYKNKEIKTKMSLTILSQPLNLDGINKCFIKVVIFVHLSFLAYMHISDRGKSFCQNFIG